MTPGTGSSTLLLVPTERERQVVASSLSEERAACVVELCGFGPVAAAVRSAYLIQRRRPRAVVLAGIAGSYDEVRAPLGHATMFSEVALHGVGAGTGPDFVAAGDMGFMHWSGDAETNRDAIGDRIPLAIPDWIQDAGWLVTCCAASATAADAAGRRDVFPAAVAEDMEGFAVAAACRMANLPLAIVRGISNAAGNRDKRTWCVDDALQAACALTRRVLASGNLERAS